MLWRTFAVSCFCAGAAFAAEPVRLKGATIKSLIGSGAMIELDTPLGTRIPIQFSPDGQMRGEAGAVASYLGAAQDAGRWWISGDKLCQQWARWLDGQKQCMTLQQNGRQILWESDQGKSGTATLTAKPNTQTAMASSPAPFGLGGAEAASAAQTAARPAREVDAFVMTAPKPASTAEPKADTAKASPRVAVATMASPPAPAEARPTPPARPPVSPFATPIPADPTFMVIGVRGSDVLNVRAGPSFEHPAVGVIPPEGRGVRVTGRCAGGWCPVEHAGRAGWVNSLYLAEEIGGGR